MKLMFLEFSKKNWSNQTKASAKNSPHRTRAMQVRVLPTHTTYTVLVDTRGTFAENKRYREQNDNKFRLDNLNFVNNFVTIKCLRISLESKSAQKDKKSSNALLQNMSTKQFTQWFAKFRTSINYST